MRSAPSQEQCLLKEGVFSEEPILQNRSTLSWESIDVHLLRVLHSLLTEGSVSRAALKLNLSQPAVSTALRRLREISGDQLLVRSRNGMTPTERGAALLQPVRVALQQIEMISSQKTTFDPSTSRRLFNIACPDYFHSGFIAEVMSRLLCQAPNAQFSFHSMGQDFDYQQALENGDLDVVLGNWPQPPENLRLSTLFDDTMVCLMRKGHPLADKELTVEDYLLAEHLLPTPYSVGRRGVIDTYLAKERLRRNVAAYLPYQNIVPFVLVKSNLVFTGPRNFAEHYAETLPLVVKPIPLDFPVVRYYMLWHDRTQYSDECRWLREQITTVTRALASGGMEE